MDNIALREFIKLTDEVRRLETAEKDAKERLVALEEKLKEQFIEDGVQKISVDGYTCYLNRQVFASAKEGNKDGLMAALKRCGPTWNFLVTETVNSNSLSARVREIIEKGDVDKDGMPNLPPSLEPVLAISEKVSIRARKA